MIEPGSSLQPGLIQAYLDTEYHVDHADHSHHDEEAPPFILRVGHPSPALSALYHRHGRFTAAYLTAWNPFSRVASEEANVGSQLELAEAVSGLGLPVLPGSGRDIRGQWPPEPSLLVLGLPMEEARALGMRFRQNAFLWCDESATPRLVLLR